MHVNLIAVCQLVVMHQSVMLIHSFHAGRATHLGHYGGAGRLYVLRLLYYNLLCNLYQVIVCQCVAHSYNMPWFSC
jgi:hypothetical protein